MHVSVEDALKKLVLGILHSHPWLARVIGKYKGFVGRTGTVREETELSLMYRNRVGETGTMYKVH